MEAKGVYKTAGGCNAGFAVNRSDAGTGRRRVKERAENCIETEFDRRVPQCNTRVLSAKIAKVMIAIQIRRV